MKRFFTRIKITGSLLILSFTAYGTITYHDFDDAMKKGDLSPSIIATTTRIVGIEGEHLYACFKSNYDAIMATEKNDKLEQKERIPRIIHQIWLGSPLPKEFNRFVQSWINLHIPHGWKYKLWTDEDIDNLNLYNRCYYDQISNYGMKSDIARWEILYRFGGFYVDIDCEALQPLDDLLSYDLVTGLQPFDSGFVQLNNALVGAHQFHPVIAETIISMRQTWNLFKGAPQKTGPVHFTRAFYRMANRFGTRDLALPSLYFYPLSCSNSIVDYDTWKQKGAYSVHWWAKSWMPKKYRSTYFRTINNDASTESWND